MKRFLVVSLCILFGLLVGRDPADAKDTRFEHARYVFIEMPQPPSNPPEIGGSMFEAAAANTVVLGWWQFDTPGGGPDPQGWTAHDLTGWAQIATYFHVAGGPGGCDAITPINGTKSMWCGQWPSASDPWCGWAALPGYGNSWFQCLEASNVTTLTYTIQWESETGYDYTDLEWWNAGTSKWVADPTANGGQGSYDGVGGPQTETVTSPYGPTKVRFHFVSDGAWSDEDGDWPSAEGAIKVDDLSIDGGAAENWEDEACGATQSSDGRWVATTGPASPGFGLYAALHHGLSVVQEDPCFTHRSYLWGFFDDPAVTNYACGGWPLQGAIPYGPDENGLYIDNEIWSPWVPIAGTGTQFLLQFLTYRDLKSSGQVFYDGHVRTRDNDTGGCATEWKGLSFAYYYGSQKDWVRENFDFGTRVRPGDDDFQVALGVIDIACTFECLEPPCHSHAPLFDQVRVVRVAINGTRWTVRDIDLWQDNFPETGGIGPTDYARCDMAQDILYYNKKNIVPGDSLKVVVTDPSFFAVDNTGGRPGRAIYVFVRVTDRFGNPVPGKNGLALQSPDNRAYATDPNAGLLRWPWVTGIAPTGWDAYRMDQACYDWGGPVTNTYCVDLMDLASGPDGPPYHPNENWAANTGVFSPGDVIHYFFGAKNTLNQWSYWHKTLEGQGVGMRTEDINGAMASPCEWSVLPDAGRLPGDLGDILFVDDADDRGGPAQLYFDFAFKTLNIEDRVDRFDVLGPSSIVGNSLAGRVKNIATQIIGDPVEVYRKVLWNSSDLSRGLMGDGGTPNGGSSAEKSNDFGLAFTFLNTHTNNPGWAYWGDDVVQDWNILTGLGAVNTKATFMNHTLTSGNQSTTTGQTSPQAFPVSPLPPAPWLRPTESFFAHGGCAGINDFDVPGQTGQSRVAHKYANATTGPNASLSQWTVNAVGDTARFYLAGFGYNFIRDDDATPPPDYAAHLMEIIQWFQNDVGAPVGIDPVAFENRLDNNYPNPFNPVTTIKYSIAERGHVSLKIYNVAGQLVRTLVNEEQAPRAGGFSVSWDGTSNAGANVASDMYFYQLTAKGFSQTKKMVFLK